MTLTTSGAGSTRTFPNTACQLLQLVPELMMIARMTKKMTIKIIDDVVDDDCISRAGGVGFNASTRVA